MPLPLVLVDIVAEHATPELTQALLRACTRAAVEAECVLADERLDESRTSAVAIVSFSTPLLVRVQVGLKQDGRWLSRQLAFTPADAPNDVFTAVGFATGTLAGRVRGGEGEALPPVDGGPAPPAIPSATVPAPPRAAPEPVPAPVARQGGRAPAGLTRRLAARAEPALASVAEGGLLAVGPSLRGFWIYRAGVSVAVSGRMVSAPRRADGLATRVWDAGVGLGFAYEPSRRVSLDLATDLLVERTSFDLREPGSGATARAGTDTLAVRLSASVSALLAGPAALFVAPELSFALEGTDVRVHDRTVLRTAAPAVGLSAGLELRLR